MELALAKKKDKPPEAGVRITIDGQGRSSRIDLIAQRDRRTAARQAKASRLPVEDDRVAQARGRVTRRLEAAAREARETDQVLAPRRQAKKEARVRAQVGKESATPERAAMAGEDQRIGDDGAQRLTDAPLDSLRSRNVITLRQFEAGDTFREDCYRAGFVPSATKDLQHVSGGQGPRVPAFLSSERAAMAADRYRAAEQALGPELSAIVNAAIQAPAGTSVSQLGREMFGRKNANEARAAFVETLKIGLDRLVAHYAPPPRSRMRSSSGEKVGVREDLWQKK